MVRFIYMLIVVSVVALTGCSSSTSNSSPTTRSKETSSSTPPHLEARAIGTTNSGEILVVPKTAETIEALGAPSCYGKETDYSIKSDYDVMFKDKTDKKTSISLSKIGNFITPDNKQLKLPTLNFKQFQAVVLAPQYTDCHGVLSYLIGTKDNDAFSFKFKTDNGTFDSFNYSPNSQLKVVDDQLVVQMGQAAGSDEAKKQLIFKPDLQNQTMQLVKS